MFMRLLLIAAGITLFGSFCVFFLLSEYSANQSGGLTLPTIVPLLFLASLASAWLGRRFSNSTVSRNVNDNEESREVGTVKWFNASKGFGFITRDNGDDVFVHFRSIRGDGHRVLKDGQRVNFLISHSDKGLQAEDVAVAR